MSKKPKRTPRRTTNPLMLLAAKQPVGGIDADRLMLPAHVHLYEVAQGEARQDAMRILTVNLAAAYDAAVYYKNAAMRDLLEVAVSAWVAARERCMARGMAERMLLTGDELKLVRGAVSALHDWLPRVELGLWIAMINESAARWDWHCNKQAA